MSTADNTAPQPDVDLDVKIGANVHTLMWHAKEKQATLAPKWGMSQAALSLKLRGKRPWFASEIDQAARHYGVTRDQLFTKLPELDSNQQPAGLETTLQNNVTSLHDHRRARPSKLPTPQADQPHNAVVSTLRTLA